MQKHLAQYNQRQAGILPIQKILIGTSDPAGYHGHGGTSMSVIPMTAGSAVYTANQLMAGHKG